MKNWKFKLAFAILMLAIAWLLFDSYQNRLEYHRFKDVAQQEFGNYDAQLIDQKNRVYEGKVIISERNKYIDDLLDSISHLKQITSSTKVKVVTRIDTVQIPIETEVTVGLDGDYIKVPLDFSKSTDWYAIKGSILKDRVSFSDLSYTNDITLNVGVKDHGNWIKNVFKRNEIVITARDNNPYSSITQLSQITLKQPKKHFHIGPQAGAYFINGKIQYSFGLGFTYSIISF